MDIVRWGIVGCGDVCEVKSGPGFQKATGSALAAVMRRDRAKAEDFARRHAVARVHATADDLIEDPHVDAVYIATHPDSHCDLAVRVARAGKPCLVEKPMALSHEECLEMIDAFDKASTPLWVAYYRRALPRFTLMRDLLDAGTIGRVTSMRVTVTEPVADAVRATNWRFDPAVDGAGLFFDMGSHTIDLMDYFAGPIVDAAGFSLNTARRYAADDVTAATLLLAHGALASGVWNFNADVKTDEVVLTGTMGSISTAVFGDADVIVTRGGGGPDVHTPRNPPHVHQPLIQTIVDELHGRGTCASTAASAARTSWAMDRIVGVEA